MNLTSIMSNPIVVLILLFLVIIAFVVILALVAKKFGKSYVDIAGGLVSFMKDALTALGLGDAQFSNLLDLAVKAMTLAISAVGSGTLDTKAESAITFFKQLMSTYAPSYVITDAQLKLFYTLFYMSFALLVDVLKVDTATLNVSSLESKLNKYCNVKNYR